MNGWIATTKLVPLLGLIPLGAVVARSFIEGVPAKVRSVRRDDRLPRPPR